MKHADFVQELYLKELKNYKAAPAVGFFFTHFYFNLSS
jgi:ATP synthase complex subunit h